MPRAKKAASTTTSKKTSPARRKTKTSGGFDFGKYYQGIRNNIAANRQKYSRYLIVIGIVLIVAIFAFIKKDWFVVAVVNREPITTIEFYQNLKAKNGTEVLNQIIQDKLILQEASRQNIQITQDAIDKKVKEVENQLGGADQLKSALAQNNLTETDFRQRIKIQLIVEKLLADQIKVADKEIDDYIAQNPTDPNVAGSATNKGPDREAIKQSLQSSKLNDKFQSWYQDLEKKSSILRFI